ncbi:tyrosine-type recombinase/integrase [Halobacillus litoralis]|uniref:Integrase n=1 Tax=Halobacillus litoralis TaxID=45668 RepID=A0A410MJE4_9BACI|nr:site-specific integrase [Halobacillus litoralis]QAS54798.1 integrase [Halobacillus litoralis]
MPFQYSKYLEDKNKSQNTIAGYLKTIHLFFSFIDNFYEKQKEPYQISPADIKNFLNSKVKEGNSIKTVNKHLTILKGFFDYLWRIEKVPVDPAMKIDRFLEEENKGNSLTYDLLKDTLPKVINNHNYTTLRKSIFILSTYGLRSAEFQIKKGNVIDHGNSVEILYPKRNLILYNDEAEIFLSYFFESQFNGSDYIFTTKKHDESLVPIEYMSLHMHFSVISQDYNFPVKITPNDIRHAYAFYLYTEKRMVVEQIAAELGIEVVSAAQLIKNSQFRHHKGKEQLELDEKLGVE